MCEQVRGSYRCGCTKPTIFPVHHLDYIHLSYKPTIDTVALPGLKKVPSGIKWSLVVVVVAVHGTRVFRSSI
jgi:hypothetical protein